MSNVQPCKDQNAIKVAVFVFEFVKPLDITVIDNTIELYNADESFKKELPRVTPHNAITIQIVDGVQKASSNELNGVSFERFNSSGELEWSIRLIKESINISCYEYTRWDEVWSKVKEYFNRMEPILSVHDVSLVGIEYLDEFIINQKDSNWKKELFNTGSKFIPNHIFELNDFWHSHHGYFSNNIKSVLGNKTLNNVNIGYFNEENVTDKVHIRMQHKYRITQSGVKITEDFIINEAENIINSNHEVNKEILRNLLSIEMLKTIQLEG